YLRSGLHADHNGRAIRRADSQDDADGGGAAVISAPLSPAGARGGRSPLTPNPSPPQGRGAKEKSSEVLPMSLANPTALLWAGLLIPVVAFYLLKTRRRRIPVSTGLFWRQIFEEKQRRSLWQRLRHLVSLLLQLVFLSLLVLALAEPF